jgi:prepilin-type N-terminal cleavage/methylation domain-containing protein
MMDAIRQHQRSYDDAGMSLVELLVSMAIILVIVAAFAFLYLALSSSATDTGYLSQSQGTVRNVVRVLEADLRSADPLLLVPSSFTADPNGPANTDVVALYTPDDRYSPCTRTTGSSIPPSPFVAQTFTANVIWAYDPVARTLTRYSYCSGAWTPAMTLSNTATQRATPSMFTPSQDTGSGTQVAIPTATIVNQSTPVCATSVTISIQVQAKGQSTVFRTRTAVPLENAASATGFGCQ